MSANPIEKKPYQPPEVKKVHLEIKNAVLAVCHTSPGMTPANPVCTPTSPCWDATTH